MEEIRYGEGSISEMLKNAWNAACDYCLDTVIVMEDYDGYGNSAAVIDKQSILNNKFEV